MDVAQGKPQLTTLCGFKSDQTEANFSGHRLKVGDAMLLAYDLKQNSVLVKLKCVCSPFALPSGPFDKYPSLCMQVGQQLPDQRWP